MLCLSEDYFIDFFVSTYGNKMNLYTNVDIFIVNFNVGYLLFMTINVYLLPNL